MKKKFNNIYSELEHCSHIPNQYYGHILTLSGMVYNHRTDSDMEIELKQLSMVYDSIDNSTLGKIKTIVHEIVFWTKSERNNRLPDIEHLIFQHRDANLEQINTLILNLAQLNKQSQIENNRQEKIVADFTPLIIQLEKLIKELKPMDNFELNLPKIIGWLTQKGFELGYLSKCNDEKTINDNKQPDDIP